MATLLNRDTAIEYASWFRALADPSREEAGDSCCA
jgi:hypothetical protein